MIVLKIGMEGGSFRIEALEDGESQKFLVFVADSGWDLIDEDAPLENRKPVKVNTLHEALRVLDRYPWYRGRPLVVHPEFRQLILHEVEKRLNENLTSPESIAHFLDEWKCSI